MKNTTLIFGLHPCKAAINNLNRKILAVYLMKEKLPQYQYMIEKLAKEIKIEILSREAFEKLIPKNSLHQGIALLTEVIQNPSIEKFLHDIKTKEFSMVIMMDQLQDPHNIGAIIRSAVAFNADAIIMPKNNTPPINSTIIKTASGGADLIPIITATNLANTLEIFKKNHFWAYALDARGKETMPLVKFAKRSLIIIGAEHNGVRELIKKKCDFIVNIPISAQLDSLNASNAAAIAMYSCFINCQFGA